MIIINKWNFSGTSTDWLFGHCFQVEFEFGNVGLLWREENWSTRRKTLGAGTRTNNKLNPHLALTGGIEPRPHWWETHTLTTVPSLLPWVCTRLMDRQAHSYSTYTWKIDKTHAWNSSQWQEMNSLRKQMLFLAFVSPASVSSRRLGTLSTGLVYTKVWIEVNDLIVLFPQEVAEFSTLLLRYKYYAFFDLNPKASKLFYLVTMAHSSVKIGMLWPVKIASYSS